MQPHLFVAFAHCSYHHRDYVTAHLAMYIPLAKSETVGAGRGGVGWGGAIKTGDHMKGTENSVMPQNPVAHPLEFHGCGIIALLAFLQLGLLHSYERTHLERICGGGGGGGGGSCLHTSCLQNPTRDLLTA